MSIKEEIAQLAEYRERGWEYAYPGANACPKCAALVAFDHIPRHEAWHEGDE